MGSSFAERLRLGCDKGLIGARFPLVGLFDSEFGVCLLVWLGSGQLV
jgi:hypothetical protein